jgi:lysozyme
MSDPIDLAAEIAKPFEGLSLDPYHDPVGYPTIGYGHLLSRDRWADLSQFPPLEDEAEADALLEADMAKAELAVARLIKVPLSPEQEAALIDFAFNCGGGNLQASTLRRVINRRQYHEAPAQFMRWTYAGGVKLRGLIRRRVAEVDLWLLA